MRSASLPALPRGPCAPGFPKAGKALTIVRLIGRLNKCLSTDMMVVRNVGDCLFAAIELRMHAHTEFLASDFYTTMGSVMLAALRAWIARPDRRTPALVGDGAFQLTGTDLASHVRF